MRKSSVKRLWDFRKAAISPPQFFLCRGAEALHFISFMLPRYKTIKHEGIRAYQTLVEMRECLTGQIWNRTSS